MRVVAFLEKLSGNSVTEAAPRVLQVGRIYPGGTLNRNPEPVPAIRMSGNWLARLGFHEGDTVNVITSPGKIQLVARRGSPPLPNGQAGTFR